MSLTSTPINTQGKRDLSSPDDIIDNKRTKQSTSVDMIDPKLSISIDMEEATLSPVSCKANSNQVNQVRLSEEDLIFISNKLSESFQEQIKPMVHSIVSSILPELVKTISQTKDDKLNALENRKRTT